MDLRTATQEIKSGGARPVYVLYGKDRFRMQGFVDYVTTTLLGQDERSLGIVKFDTAETPIEEVVLEAETLPFFASRKILLVRDQSLLAAGGKEGKVTHQADELIRYLKEPLETSTIVFVVHADKLDERRKLVKLLKERDALLLFQELEGKDLYRWIAKRAKDQNRTIAEDAAELLVLRAGANLQKVAQEVDKLCLYAGDGGTISRREVELLTASSTEEDVFALVDAIASLQSGRALTMYRELLLRREEPIKIAALLARQFRILLQVKELDGQRFSPQQMASQLGLHPYVVKLSLDKARSFEVKMLGGLLSRLADLDYKMKTGQIDKVLGLELFLISLSRPA
ncbi:DNA polymerase III subunit delta [Paenibacillus sp. 1P07SE]|uniref:DNA polymerase III subunit delta n=1 Tax=Paenibacillus sp. 1P07SE TaxID=3132209 RepID=UPI0039A4D3EB